MATMRPVVLGLIASACIALVPTALFKDGFSATGGLSTLFNGVDIFSVVIATIALVAVLRLKVSPIIVVLLSGALGVVFYATIG